MRNLKRVLSLALAALMLMGMMVIGAGAASKDFTDADEITNVEAVDVMVALGVLEGGDKGDFQPNSILTREQAAKIICYMLLGEEAAEKLTTNYSIFSDVPANRWSAPYISYCVNLGILAGDGAGHFYPEGKLTGVAFAKMLLVCLGYSADRENYVGNNWEINVSAAAIASGIAPKALDLSKELSRQDAAQMAFNTLEATMVEYLNDNTIIIGDTTVSTVGKASAVKQYPYANTMGGEYLQFAEKYFGKLKKLADTDAFMRPTTTWTYNNETVGSFVNYDQMIAEYTTAVSGKEMYDVVGTSAFKNYEFSAYVNGEKSTMWKEIAKDNKANVSNTANGALTQVFADNDNETITVTVINTYLAQATADYNEKKDTASFKIYNLDGKDTVKSVSGEDFNVSDVVADDFVLVTYADDAIQSISDVEILAETEISKFSTSGGTVDAVTVDGTKYDASTKLSYDTGVLDDYTTAGGSINLKDTIYNVYLDQYGYVIGVDIVEGATNYVFITGADSSSSNLTTKTWAANAIFMDGTSAVIDVKNTNSALADKPVINQWFKYTKSSSNVYTLTAIESTTPILSNSVDNEVAQWQTKPVTDIDAKHISLEGIQASSKSDTRVYGNENTVYLLADLDKVSKGGTDYAVIKGAAEIVTGINNAAFVTYDRDAARTAVKATNGAVSGDTTSSGAYALYGDDGYIIAAVVVGDSSTVAKNVAYVNSGSVSSESYSPSTSTWTWTRDVIINGEKVELTETNDTGVSALKSAVMTEGAWVIVRYDADGNVKAVDALTAKDGYVDTVENAVKAIESGEDLVYLQVDEHNQYSLKGSTLYDLTTDKLGFLVASDVKIVLEQEVNNKTVTTYDEGVTTLKSILEDLNDVSGKGYEFNAVIEDGRATSVIIIDEGADGDYTGPDGGNNDGTLTLNSLSFTGENGIKINFTNNSGAAFQSAAKADVVIKNADGVQVCSFKGVAVNGSSTQTAVANGASGNVIFDYTGIPSNTGNYTVTLTITAGHGTFTVTQVLGTI